LINTSQTFYKIHKQKLPKGHYFNTTTLKYASPDGRGILFGFCWLAQPPQNPKR
jgi:hypothetical protein